MNKPTGPKPATAWVTYFRALRDAFPLNAVTDDYGGNIYLTKGSIPVGYTMIVTPNGDFLPEGILVGLYADDNDEPAVTPGVVWSGKTELDVSKIPAIVAAVNDVLAASAARGIG